MTNGETNAAAPEGETSQADITRPNLLAFVPIAAVGGAFRRLLHRAGTRQIRAAQHRQLEAGSSNDAAGGGNKQSAEDFVFPGCICGIFAAARGSTECALMAACFGGNA